MRERLRDYAILLGVSILLTLPNLGATSLWDVDEGVNAEAAREMLDNDTWVIPTFNYKLRTAKPVMLYWLQRISFSVFGVNEWAARLPSVLAAWLTVLLTYELARRMFGRATGLLAGVVLASAFEFCMLAHAATPDSVLLLFTVLTYYLFWRLHQTPAYVARLPEAGHRETASVRPATEYVPSRRWWVPTAAACGLAVLTKGPIGVGLPGLVLLLYFAWNRELGRLLDRKIVAAALVFLLVAGPWYGLVTAETRGEWVRAFIGKENLHRFTTPMENHRGPIYYHAAGLLVLFAPWSVFLFVALWYGVKAARGETRPTPPTPLPEGRGEKNLPSPWGEGGSRSEPGEGKGFPSANTTPSPGGEDSPLPAGRGVGGVGTSSPRPFRFLLCWFAVYLVVFSVAATKLPNYVLPLYPALAILAARFITRWQSGELVLPRWVMPTVVGGMVLTGVLFAGGMLVAGDAVKVLPRGARMFPGLERWAFIGAIPLAAAVVMALAIRAGDRARFVRAMALAAVAFTALVAAFPPLAIENAKAPRELVRASGADDPARDLRLAQFNWFQPSLVFYARREVLPLKSVDEALGFLMVPTPAYLFIPVRSWAQIEARVPVPTRVVARHYDYTKNTEVLVITNDVTAVAGR